MTDKPLKKFLHGVMEFQQTKTKESKSLYENLASGQAPNCFVLTCSDSRVLPLYSSNSKGGEVFYARNVGNLIPEPTEEKTKSDVMGSLIYAASHLGVKHFFIVGHSDCGAMGALLGGREKLKHQKLLYWYLEDGEQMLQEYRNGIQEKYSKLYSEIDNPKTKLAIFNCQYQCRQLLKYDFMSEKVKEGKIFIHPLFYDIKKCEILAMDPEKEKFVSLDESLIEKMLKSVGEN
ncbi:carbonic anhydrase [Anaeramoeba flamelloides]|uniref:Carbonic anhydrase n=1 Tax=Anaeramoeba flamelloides TaxID=1746091 RepID=A0ABQ8Z367_9EUKA|nr:carbonic anhydrase [Anaeramoeba flamelloides]